MSEVYESRPVQLSLTEQLRSMWLNRRDRRRLSRLALKAAKESRPDPRQDPLIFFNASTRLVGLSQNAAFSFLTALGLQQAGLPVIHFGCRSGMTRCVLGTVRRRPQEPPPCSRCIAQSERLFGHAPIVWFKYQPEQELERALQGLDVAALSRFEFSLGPRTIPLGELVLPSIRWALRQYDLQDDEDTRFFLRAYLQSAYRLAVEYEALLKRLDNARLVIFNGILYPEATARWVGQQYQRQIITFEVAYRPFSAFFSHRLATRYPIDIPADFELTPAQDQALDKYLERRFQGKFSMAGVQFWPEIRGLDHTLVEKIDQFRQLVPVFTNVIYDTSQVDTNLAFHNMFDWLDHLLPSIHSQTDTLFVIRAHPDEQRPGKESRQSVADWVAKHQIEQLANVVFVPSRQFLSSYELIQRAKFVLVYNSSIGLEATLLGKPVVCAAESRYTQYPIVYFPQTAAAYQEQLETMLAADRVSLPPDSMANARRFLYYQLFRASLPFEAFIENAERPGFVHLRQFPLEALHPDQCPTTRVILEGITHNQPFLLPETQTYEREN